MSNSQGTVTEDGDEDVRPGKDIQISARRNAYLGLEGAGEEWMHREWEN